MPLTNGVNDSMAADDRYRIDEKITREARTSDGGISKIFL
jgi:hypothetical protein